VYRFLVQLSELVGKTQEKQPVRKGLWLAQDWEDKKWYRARYEGRGSEGHTMVYVDTGVVSECAQVKRIPAGHELLTFPPCAMKCGLYGVKTNDDFWEQAAEKFFHATKGMVHCLVEKIVDGASMVTYITVKRFTVKRFCGIRN